MRRVRTNSERQPNDACTIAGLMSETSTKRPNKRGALTRERIVHAAIDCFSEYGYTGTRISDVAHRANISQGNFYRHFTSLDDVFLAVLRQGLAEVGQANSRTPSSDDELTSLIEVNSTYLHAYSRHRHTLRLLREAGAASENTGFHELWLNMRADFITRTRRWLLQRQESGHLSDVDVDLMAEALGCMTEQMAYIHVGLPHATPKRERIDQLGEALGHMWYCAVAPLPDAGRRTA